MARTLQGVPSRRDDGDGRFSTVSTDWQALFDKLAWHALREEVFSQFLSGTITEQQLRDQIASLPTGSSGALAVYESR